MIVEQDENMQMELLTPLTANFMPETSYWNELDEDDEAWDYEYDGLPLDGTDLVQYKDAIQEMVDKENSFGSEDGKPCNLMQYFDGSPAIKEKVESAVVSVKEVNRSVEAGVYVSNGKKMYGRELSSGWSNIRCSWGKSVEMFVCLGGNYRIYTDVR